MANETTTIPENLAAKAQEKGWPLDLVQQALAKLFKKHKPDGTVALVVPEPLASIVRHVLTHVELGDLWHSSEDAGKWELIDVTEAVTAK